MMKTILVMPDGTELSSGVNTQNAIIHVAVTECVNDSQELSPGSVCANMLEVSIFSPNGDLSIAAGEELTVYKQDNRGMRHKVGLFLTEKPTRPTANTIKLTAYDRIIRLDKDLTGWLAGLTEWPYSLGDLADKVCKACGLELVGGEIPNGAYPVQKFSADGITGRQLMRWIGQIAGRFCRANAEGKIELAWYTPLSSVVYNNANLNIASGEIAVTDGKLVSDTLQILYDADNASVAFSADVENLYYYQNGLSFEDYSVAPIEKVQLRQNEEDVGTIYPDVSAEANTYTISGNYLLSAASGDALRGIAQTLYEQMRAVTYTPCRISIPATLDIHAGTILQLSDPNGKPVTAYVMTKRQNGQRDTLECTGSLRRDSSAAVNNRTYRTLAGKVFNLRTDVDGIRAENAAADGRMASLVLRVDGISAEVSSQQKSLSGVQESLTVMSQDAQQMALSVRKIQTDGVDKVITQTGYSFDAEGLKITKTGQEMENLLTEKGMYVKRLGETILQADNSGVTAVDVSVRNYLIIGNHARLEDYNDGAGGKRTACFFMGGS